MIHQHPQPNPAQLLPCPHAGRSRGMAEVYQVWDRQRAATPVMSLATLATAMDWAFTHANPFIRHPIEIHLLYVPQTPEEQAMLDFADTE